MINDEYTDDRLNNRYYQNPCVPNEPKQKFVPVPKVRYPKYRDANHMP